MRLGRGKERGRRRWKESERRDEIKGVLTLCVLSKHISLSFCLSFSFPDLPLLCRFCSDLLSVNLQTLDEFKGVLTGYRVRVGGVERTPL